MVILFIAVAAVGLYLLRFGHSYDDAYITFRYAKNLAGGDGFVYNPGQHVLGSTAPGFGLLLGILGVPGRNSIPFIADCVLALSLAGLGVALYVYGRINGQRLCGFVVGLLAVSSPFVLLTDGGEMILLLALVTWGFVAYSADRTGIAALLLALATLVRSDGFLALLLLGAHYVVARRRFPFREALLVGSVLLPFVLAAALIYGSPVPNTLAAKIAQRESGLWEPFLPQAVAWLLGPQVTKSLLGWQPAALGSQSSEGVYVALGVIGTICTVALPRFRFWLLPLLWAGGQTLSYAALDVPFYHWYAAPLALCVAITAAIGITAIAQRLWRTASVRKGFGRGDLGRLVGVGIIAALAVYGLSAATSQRLAGDLARTPAGVPSVYRLVSKWLNANTPTGSSVGYDEIGYIGFHSHNRIVDPFGLVTAGASRFIARRELDGAYRRDLPDYLIFGLVVPTPTESWFTTRYVPVARLTGPGRHLTVYKRRRS